MVLEYLKALSTVFHVLVGCCSSTWQPDAVTIYCLVVSLAILAYTYHCQTTLWPLQQRRSGFLPRAVRQPPATQVSLQDPSLSEDIFNTLTEHVYNEMPIRLIYLETMSLIERPDYLMYFHGRILTKAAGMNGLGHGTSRQEAINSLVRDCAGYAILSHRWLDQAEPTYQDMKIHPRPEGPGFKKLAKFCQAARAYGVDFAWSDTCCIDKTSSSELEESIRSMFRWYKTATVCIVYLAQTNSLDELPFDQWFTRGWTLQELLAPHKLKFYGSNWDPLTVSRFDIDRELRRTTPNSPSRILAAVAQGSRIHEDDLLTFLPGAVSVHIRMTWASGRRTTRGEDRAYSLMGLFDVSFPIAYGEGAERAFRRLQEAIMQNSPKTEVLHWAGDASELQISRAIPSSPDCYNHANPPPSEVRFRTRQSLSLTSMGLRVSLLILPLHPLSSIHQQEITFRCEAYDIGDITIRSKFTGKWNIRSLDPRWALGVYNYYETVDGLYLERLSVAYLLASTLTGWTKIPTECIISFSIAGSEDTGYRVAEDSEVVRMDI